jgi:hypothetical protein
MTSASASRVTRSRRSLRLALLLFAGVLAAVTVLRAQEAAPPPADKAAEPAQAAGKAAPAADTAGKDGAAPAGAAQQPRPAAPGTASPSRFEPTEKVRADFDVSFPIDI